MFTELKASETGLIPSHELDDLKKDMTEDQYLQEFECSFNAAIVGAFYGREMLIVDEQKRISDVPYDENVPVYTAWDLGHTDDTAIWFYQVVGGEIHLIEYYAASGMDVDRDWETGTFSS